MTFWGRLIDGLVVAFALFFVFLGLGFLYYAATGASIWGSSVDLEGGPRSAKAMLGLIFLLAAAPMFYYVFHPSAKGMPPAREGSKPPGGTPP